MKKRFFAFAALVAAAGCLGGCSLTSSEGGKGDYDLLNEMLKAQYSQIVLTVENDFGGDTLTSVYTIKYGEYDITTVSYTVEKFAPFDPDAPDEIKKTLAGSMTLQGDTVVETDGADLEISAEIARLPFAFEEAYFENAELGEDLFEADVKNVSGFLGSALSCTDMTVKARFGEAFDRIEIGYTDADGAGVSISYTFTA